MGKEYGLTDVPQGGAARGENMETVRMHEEMLHSTKEHK